MSQFAVFKSPGSNPEVLFVVQIQSDRLANAAGRLVMALNSVKAAAPPDHPLTPRLAVQGHSVYANPFNIATIPGFRLKAALETLAEIDQDKVIRALDEFISRA